MTERIDLDDLDVDDDERDGPNPGDWFWRGDDDSADRPAGVTDVKTDAATAPERAESSGSESRSPGSGPVPRVPRENDDKPAGIPVESGGAGAGTDASADADGGASAGTSAGAEPPASAGDDRPSASTTDVTEASGPHGGGADDMTLAFTYGAATRLADFGRVAADATGWADWLGIVGDVPAHVLNKFQRDRNVDLDFFNGSARGPGERLAAIDRHSMFYAERTVVVGVEGEDEAIAETADWEFVPLANAAEKAGWELTK